MVVLAKAAPKVVHLYEQYWWLDLKDIIAAIAVVVAICSLVIAVIVYRSSVNSRRFDLTLKAIHFYNHEVRKQIKVFKGEFAKQVSDSEYEKLGDSYTKDESIKAIQLMMARDADIASLVHYLGSV